MVNTQQIASNSKFLDKASNVKMMMLQHEIYRDDD